MKKYVLLSLAFLLFLSGCTDVGYYGDTSETIGEWSCSGQRKMGEIIGYATCKTVDGRTYNGEVFSHQIIGKGKMIDSDGGIREGYFYGGSLISGKITRNGNTTKGMRTKNNNTLTLELGKVYYDNGEIDIGEFDKGGNMTYGTKFRFADRIEGFFVGYFNNGTFQNGYLASNAGCWQYNNGKETEITKTIKSSTSNGLKLNSNPLGDYYRIGGKGNPINVNVTFE